MKIKLYTFPNFVTLGNLLCGSVAALAAAHGRVDEAFLLIVLAAVFDFLDGFCARLLHSYSETGAELDSLADLVSFGLAPTVMLIARYDVRAGGWIHAAGGALLFAVVLFAALRLARFNVDKSQHSEFRGLPVPAGALLIASLVTGFGALPNWGLTLLAVAVAALMVSPIRMFALKFHGFGWRGNELRYSFIAVSLALIAALGLRAVAAIILLYVAVSAVRFVAVLHCRPIEADETGPEAGAGMKTEVKTGIRAERGAETQTGDKA